MKRLLLTLALLFAPALAHAQCNGIFPANTVCGNPSGSPNIPSAMSPSAFQGSAGGSSGQIQYNNSGNLAGFTASGDCTINTSTGAVTCTNVARVGSANAFTGTNSFTGLTTLGQYTVPTSVKTANYTVATTDCGSLIQMGTGATGLITTTLPSPSGFTNGCAIVICNGDTARGKKTSGYPSDINPILWPLQCTTQGVVNGAWKTLRNPGRWLIPTTEELCWRQDGDDTSDGLGNGTVAADCKATIQNAVTTIGTQWDGGGYNACNIGLYTGGTSIAFEAVTQTGQSVGCYLSLYFRGAITWKSNTSCFSGGDNGITIFYMNVGPIPILQCNLSNLTATAAFYCHQTCIYDIFGSFEWIPGGLNDNLLFIDGQGRVTVAFTGGGLVVGDGAPRAFDTMFWCDQHCAQLQVSGPIGFSSSVTCSRIFRAYELSAINTSASFTGSCSGITTSISSGGSVINTNGSSILGGTTTAGTGGAGVVCTSKC